MTTFHKFHGTGNDFIMLDGRHLKSSLSPHTIASLCHRRFGIGADGLIIVNTHPETDFEMTYYNADGSLAKMCGNGARCAVAFSYMNGLTGSKVRFLAGDGFHTACVEQVNGESWTVEISMGDTLIPEVSPSGTEINTGTQHLVNIVENIEIIDTVAEGRKIRYSDKYKSEGINVNWMCIENDSIQVRTYERGVEDETLSCGTGVTACALIASLLKGKNEWKIETAGGSLKVTSETNGRYFTNIWLSGPAVMAYRGEVYIAECE